MPLDHVSGLWWRPINSSVAWLAVSSFNWICGMVNSVMSQRYLWEVLLLQSQFVDALKQRQRDDAHEMLTMIHSVPDEECSAARAFYQSLPFAIIFQPDGWATSFLGGVEWLISRIENELDKGQRRTDRVVGEEQDEVAKTMSSMWATDGKGTTHGDYPLPMRQVHLEGQFPSRIRE